MEQLRDIARPMNIEDLLTHRSGLTYDFLMGAMLHPYIVHKIFQMMEAKNLKEKCETLSQLPLAYQPGTRFNYSVSLDVLARIIEVVSGKDFYKYLKKKFLILSK